VPTDQYDFAVDQAPGGEVAWYPGSPVSPAPPRSTTPLPVAERPPTDFLWQRPPTALKSSPQPATYSEPGIDYLTPYWLVRYFTEVAPPANQPLPTWPGPASR
jgi:hypothetical protein